MGDPQPPTFREASSSAAGQGLGLSEGGSAGTMKGSSGPGESVTDQSNPGEGTPAWECPSTAVLVLIWGLGEEFGEKGSKVVVSSLLPHPNLYPIQGGIVP